MIVPEILLKLAIEAIIKYVRQDFNNCADEKDSLLYLMFEGNTYGTFDFFQQVKELMITRGDEGDRAISVNLMFNPDRVTIPTIHITIPTDSAKDNSIGVDPDTDEDTGIRTYSRRFQASYMIIITSTTPIEVIILYYFIRNMLITIFDTLSLAGLDNIQIGGQDLRLASSAIPSGVFSKSITISADYDAKAKVSQEVLVDIRRVIFSGTMYED